MSGMVYMITLLIAKGEMGHLALDVVWGCGQCGHLTRECLGVVVRLKTTARKSVGAGKSGLYVSRA